MSHEIESEFVNEWLNEATQCHNCVSFRIEDGENYCTEAKAFVPGGAHCDYFQAKD